MKKFALGLSLLLAGCTTTQTEKRLTSLETKADRAFENLYTLNMNMCVLRTILCQSNGGSREQCTAIYTECEEGVRALYIRDSGKAELPK